ncbi:MAG: 50S ribosomal protein L29 [Epsilonproteobacteria bacterium]|nr:50S ribosomal protein L29 [Campylobacterota bacterium]
MKYIEIKDKSLTELTELLKARKLAYFTTRVKIKTIQLTKTSELRNIKKDIARISTAISTLKKGV